MIGTKGYPNRYSQPEPSPIPLLRIEESAGYRQLERLRAVRVKRTASRVRETLAAVEAAARSGHNFFVPELDPVKDYATLGEISDVFPIGMRCLPRGWQLLAVIGAEGRSEGRRQGGTRFDNPASFRQITPGRPASHVRRSGDLRNILRSSAILQAAICARRQNLGDEVVREIRERVTSDLHQDR